ncbi:MAG: FAD-binding oxidoreductase [Anaerolineales bacterium]|nr:FAD-binding oxidoreductase [Anaerolineales bacterium]
MRRWNGWGEESIEVKLPHTAIRYLNDYLGSVHPEPDCSLDDVISLIPPSRLPPHPLISCDSEDRLRHSRGQSLPDWIALRSGKIDIFPDGVAYPKNEEEIKDLFTYSRQNAICLIPYGGGTSVVGHINPNQLDIPSVALDLSRLNNFHDLDKTSQIAKFGAGIRGPDLEQRLHREGYTLGHFPQSFEYSTLGGWVATRSCGQQSHYYGRIEDMFAGGQLISPAGTIKLLPFPASAAGPDLRQIILGSEGRFGVLTEVIVRVKPLPEVEEFYGVFFHDWESGYKAVKEIAQSDIPVSMLRLSDPEETQVTLALSDDGKMVPLGKQVLKFLGYSQGYCLLIYAITARKKHAGNIRAAVSSILRKNRGLGSGKFIGNKWRHTRFSTPYLRNSIWEYGLALDTLETAVSWNQIRSLCQAVKGSIRNALSNQNEKVLVFSHLSHVYNYGASVYFTYLFRRSSDPGLTLHHWYIIKSAASQSILDYGGTISHQHGVGLDHIPYLSQEKGQLGMQTLENLSKTFDPDGILNPGVLIPDANKFRDER